MAELFATFENGMDMDSSKIAYPNNSYLYAENLRPITEEGQSNLSLSNIKGTELFANYIPPHDNSVIVATTTIRKNIVLFVKNLNNSADYIYELVYDLEQDSYTQTTIWSGTGLDFSLDKKYSIVSRYESANIIKLYWTDGVSTLKYANIGISLTGYTVEDFEILPIFTHTKPEFDSYIGGDLLPGVIQYAYRLVKKNGPETTFSSVSELIPLSNNNMLGISQTVLGQGYLDDITTSGRGVRLKFTLSNTTDFDYIEVISFHYSSIDAQPTIKVVALEKINSIVYINDGGNNNLGDITLDEFRFYQPDYFPKVLATKDNRLFMANINEKVFDINDYIDIANQESFDARIYRANSEGKCRVFNSALTEAKFIDPSFVNNIIDDDLVNLYNLPEYDYSGEDFCKYLTDGTTLGAEGTVFKLTFEKEVYLIANSSAAIGSVTISESPDTVNPVGGYTCVANAPYLHGRKKLLKADEIYRFGVVFKDSKGRNSFTYWMADIRMPSWLEIQRTVAANGKLYGVAVIPQIEVKQDTLPIAMQELQYQIVYVKRNYEDRTILTQGFVEPAIKYQTIESKPEFRPNRTVNYTIGDYSPYAVSTSTHIMFSPEVSYGTDVVRSGVYVRTLGNLVVTQGSGQYVYSPTVQSVLNDYNLVVEQLKHTLESIVKFKAVIGNPAPNSVTFNVGNNTYVPVMLEVPISNYSQFSAMGSHLILNYENSLLDASVFADLKRDVVQYGGNTYSSRLNNVYIPLSPVVEPLGTARCYYGDTYLNVHKVLRNIFGPYCDTLINNNQGATIYYKYISNMVYYPAETSINTTLAHSNAVNEFIANTNSGFLAQEYAGTHIVQKLTSGNTEVPERTYIQSQPLYAYNTAYSKVNDTEIFIADNPEFTLQTRNDCIVRYSNLKYNNEERDKWLKFSSNDFNEVQSSYGQITNIVDFNDNLYVFQYSGLSIAAINDKATITSDLGTPTTLGTGGVLPYFKYLSTDIGCQYNSDIIQSRNSLYWLDGNTRKLYRLSSKSLETLSDLKNISSYFKNTIDTHSYLVGTLDSRYNEILLTFSNKAIDSVYFYNTEAILVSSPTALYDYTLLPNTKLLAFRTGVDYTLNGSVFRVISTDYGGIQPEVHLKKVDDSVVDIINYFSIAEYVLFNNNTTLVFNEMMDKFTGFYSFTPNLYINTDSRLFSYKLTEALTGANLWEHNIGEFNKFYDVDYNSTLDLLLSAKGQVFEYNNITAFTEVYDEILGKKNETFSSVKAWNDYQETDEVIIYPMSQQRYVLDTSGYKIDTSPKPDNTQYYLANARMNIGKWNMPVPRHRSDFDEYSAAEYGQLTIDYKDKTNGYEYHPTSDRIRNFYTIFRFKYDPTGQMLEMPAYNTFSFVDNSPTTGTYLEPYTISYTLTRTDNYPTDGYYNVTATWDTGSYNWEGSLSQGGNVVLTHIIPSITTEPEFIITLTGTIEETITVSISLPQATFSMVDNGTDANAYTDQNFTIRKTLTRTDIFAGATGDYNLLFTYPGLINNSFGDTLGIGQSVDIVSAKTLTGISGEYTIDISGSVTDSVVRDVTVYTDVLYNRYAALDARELGITGWHIPSYTEATTLSAYLGFAGIAGGKLKTTGFTYWDSPNTGATNSSGFSAKGVGYRDLQGVKKNKKLNADYHLQNLGQTSDVFGVSNTSTTFILSDVGNTLYGCSIRLLKNDNIFPTDPIIDLDGNIYTAIQIGTQIWLQQDLRVTKYLNGDTIPNVISDVDWANLTAGALCYY